MNDSTLCYMRNTTLFFVNSNHAVADYYFILILNSHWLSITWRWQAHPAGRSVNEQRLRDKRELKFLHIIRRKPHDAVLPKLIRRPLLHLHGVSTADLILFYSLQTCGNITPVATIK